MAEANISVALDQFSCSVCLDLLKDPVTLHCGHSFCIKCINNCWDQEDQQGVYSCPQCRHTFTPRPAVSKNTVLAEVVETLRNTRHQDAPSADCSAVNEDVECDSCTERKSKAIKSCLVCLASFCETHLQPHYKSPVFKKHKLVEASSRLQEQICSQHDKLLEVYCRTDQRCICMLCTMDEHKGHDTISAAAGRAEKQTQLLEVQKKYQQRMQETAKKLQELRKAVESHKLSADTVVQECQKLFTGMIKTLERRCSEVTTVIRAQEKAAVSRAEEVMKQLEQEIAKLRRIDAELEELSHAEDHIYFFQNFRSVSAPLGHSDLPTITVNSLQTFEDVKESVSQLKTVVEKHCKNEIDKMSGQESDILLLLPETLCTESSGNDITRVKNVRVIPPQSRKDMLEFFCQFTLDPSTNSYLCLSDWNTEATCTSFMPYYGYQESYTHVFCKDSVCESCYWEVEWSGGNGVSIAVSYKDISKKEYRTDCAFGRDVKSWSLLCSLSGYSFLHNNQETKIPVKPSSSKIGVFVNYKEGTLSFYSVSYTFTLIHKVKTVFTQPLYPGFRVNSGSNVKLCCLK